MVSFEQMNDNSKIGQAKKWFDMAKRYEQVSDYKTARGWMLEAYKLYCVCKSDKNNEELLRGKGKCEVALIDLSEKCGLHDETLLYANRACLTYEILSELDPEEFFMFLKIEKRRDDILLNDKQNELTK